MSLPERWRRFLDAFQNAPVPEIILSTPAEHFLRGTLQNQSANDDPVLALCAGYSIDPPVGGFAAGDILLYIPGDDPAVQIVAPTAVVNTPSDVFEAGLFDIFVSWTMPLAITSAQRYRLTFTTTAGLTGGRLRPAAPAAVDLWGNTLSLNRQLFVRAWFPDRWFMRLTAGTALDDADVMTLEVAVSCVQPIEQRRAQF